MNILDSIKDYLMQGLNANDLDLHFFITTDVGKYKKPDRVGNKIIDYINGQLTVINSSTLPTQGLEVSTQTIQLSLIVPLRSMTGDESTIVKNVRTVLEQYLSQNRILLLENGSKHLANTINFSLPNSGSVEQRSGIGTYVELLAFLYITTVENGFNSMDRKYYLNGELLPYTTATRSRVPIAETNSFASESDSLSTSNYGQGKNLMQSTALGFDFTIVALDPTSSSASQIIQNFLNTGTLNQVYTLKVETGSGENAISTEYSVLFGQVSEISEGVQNVGYKISFVEAATEIIQDIEGDEDDGS